MKLTPQQKIKYILLSVGGIIILAALSPFIFSSDAGLFPREFIRGTFLVTSFLIIAYLWNWFNELRVIANKKELEDEDLEKLKRDVEKLTHQK